AEAIAAVANRALLLIHLLAPAIIELRRLCEFRITPSRQLHAGWRSLCQKISVAFERDQNLVFRGRGLAVHAEKKAALQPFLERIHMAVLGAIRGIEHIGRP